MPALGPPDVLCPGSSITRRRLVHSRQYPLNMNFYGNPPDVLQMGGSSVNIAEVISNKSVWLSM